MKLSLLIPFRSRDPHRVAVRKWTERWWANAFPDAEIIYGRDDGHDPFCKAAAVNDAASRATGDVLGILDADAIVEPASIDVALQVIAQSGKWFMASDVNWLGPEITDRLLRADPTAPTLPAPRREDRLYSNNAYGLLHLVSRDAWDRVGGMDERFRGWGGEDDAFARALTALWRRPDRLAGKAYHLWHPVEVDPTGKRAMWRGQSTYLNADLVLRYKSAGRNAQAMRAVLGGESTGTVKTLAKRRAGARADPPTQPTIDEVAPSRVSVLVPFRDDGTRGEGWEYARAQWEKMLPGAEIVVGEDDDEPFSKSAAVNDAFLRSRGEIMIVADADSWLDSQHVAEGILRAGEDRLVVPWRIVYRLAEASSRELIEGGTLAQAVARKPDAPSPAPATAGTLFIISRRAFEQVSGMDPRFRGWGHEDVSFRRCCDVLLGKTIYLRGNAYAMWHPRPYRKGRVWGDADPGALNTALNGAYVKAERRPDLMRELTRQHPLGEESEPYEIPARDPRGPFLRESIYTVR